MPGHHTVDFFEIPVLDMAGAKAFYAAAFGWSYEDHGQGWDEALAGAEVLGEML